MHIGSKIKEKRLLLGLTQEELANRCELTKGYISQLENDKTDPSIQTLEQILSVLGTNIAEFFIEKKDKVQVTFSEDEQYDTIFNGYIQSWLVPTSQAHAMEPIYIVLDQNKETLVDLPHEGEEFGYIIEGKIELILGEDSYICNTGESFYYKSTVKHYIRNIGNTKAKILWVSCPPNF